MQAYERSMQKGDTNLVLGPDSDFFRYFGDPAGKGPVQAGDGGSAVPGKTGAQAARVPAPALGPADTRAAATGPAK
jgi:modulator of FtsH protease HflC